MRIKIHTYKTLIGSILSLSILKGLNMILPLVTLPYILRVIGVANYGSYSYIYILMQYLLLFTSYGFNYSATKQISVNRNTPQKINRIYNSVILCRFSLLIIGLFFLWIISPLLIQTGTDKMMFLMGIGIVIGDILNPVWLFQGMEKMKYMTIANIVAKSTFTILIFFFIKEPSDFTKLILFNSMGFLLSGITSTIIAKKQFQIRLSLPSFDDLKSQMQEGLQLFISSIGINIYSNANIFILKFLVDETSLGIFSAVDKVIKGLKTLGSPISQALFPHLGYRFKDQPIRQSIRQLKKAAISFSIFLLIITTTTLILSQQILLLFGGEEFIKGTPLLQIMSPTIILGGLNALLGFSGLVNLNRAKDFTKGVFISGTLSLITIIVLVPSYGVNLAAIVTTFSELILLSVIIFSLIKIKE